jgi:hypothetical protein
MNRLSKILIFMALPCLCLGQEIFDHDGNPFAKAVQKTAEPKIIVDTVAMVDGWGSLTLNDNFSKGKHNVAPTEKNNIFVMVTQLLVDSTADICAYGYCMSADGRRIIIKSSDVLDNGKVVIQAILK